MYSQTDGTKLNRDKKQHIRTEELTRAGIHQKRVHLKYIYHTRQSQSYCKEQNETPSHLKVKRVALNRFPTCVYGDLMITLGDWGERSRVGAVIVVFNVGCDWRTVWAVKFH